MNKTLAVFLLALSFSTGCGDSKQCEEFADHLTGLTVDAKKKGGGAPVTDEMRAEAVKQTLEACKAEPPSKEALDCALAAQSLGEMKRCDPDYKAPDNEGAGG